MINIPTNTQTDSIWVFCKKIRWKSAIVKKFATRTLVSTKQTNRVPSTNHTSGVDKIFFLSDLISRGLRGKITEKSDQNSNNNFSGLAGLKKGKTVLLNASLNTFFRPSTAQENKVVKNCCPLTLHICTFSYFQIQCSYPDTAMWFSFYYLGHLLFFM